MKLLLPFMVFWLALAGCALIRDQTTTVTAFVSSKPVAGEDLADRKRISVRFTLHTPTGLRGSEFHFVTLDTLQAEVGKKFLFRGLWEFRLTHSMIGDLKKQLVARESIDRQVKAGIDPLMISQTYSIPVIRSETLLSEPRIVGIKP